MWDSVFGILLILEPERISLLLLLFDFDRSPPPQPCGGSILNHWSAAVRLVVLFGVQFVVSMVQLLEASTIR